MQHATTQFQLVFALFVLSFLLLVFDNVPPSVVKVRSEGFVRARVHSRCTRTIISLYWRGR